MRFINISIERQQNALRGKLGGGVDVLHSKFFNQQ